MKSFNAATVSGSTLSTNNLQVVFMEKPGKTLTVNLSPEAQSRLLLTLLARDPASTLSHRILVVHGTSKTQFDTPHPLAGTHAALNIALDQKNQMSLRLAIPDHQLASFQKEVAALKLEQPPRH